MDAMQTTPTVQKICASLSRGVPWVIGIALFVLSVGTAMASDVREPNAYATLNDSVASRTPHTWKYEDVRGFMKVSETLGPVRVVHRSLLCKRRG